MIIVTIIILRMSQDNSQSSLPLIEGEVCSVICTLNVCKAFELKSKMPSTSLLHYVARWFDNGKTLKR